MKDLPPKGGTQNKNKMNEKHYKEKLSAFVNHELAGDERQRIAEHLLICADCRREHDEIKLGSALASHLKQSDAAENLWHKIENSLDGKAEKTKVLLIPNFAFFSFRAVVAAAGLLIFCALMTAVYFGYLRTDSQEMTRNEKPIQTSNIEIPRDVSTPSEIIPNQNSNQTTEANSAKLTPSNVILKLKNPLQSANSNGKVSRG